MSRRVHILEQYSANYAGYHNFISYRYACQSQDYTERVDKYAAATRESFLSFTRDPAAVRDGSAADDVTCKSCRRAYGLPVPDPARDGAVLVRRPTQSFGDLMATEIRSLDALGGHTRGGLAEALGVSYEAPIYVSDIYTRFSSACLLKLPRMGKHTVRLLDACFARLGIPLLRTSLFFECADSTTPLASPHERLISGLSEQWLRPDASVLADWCEERSLHGVARPLRFGPTIECHAALIALARVCDLTVSRVDEQPLFTWLANDVAAERAARKEPS